jgi:hypothetical protein
VPKELEHYNFAESSVRNFNAILALSSTHFLCLHFFFIVLAIPKPLPIRPLSLG